MNFNLNTILEVEIEENEESESQEFDYEQNPGEFCMIDIKEEQEVPAEGELLIFILLAKRYLYIFLHNAMMRF